MFFTANLLLSIADLLNIVFTIYQYILIAACLITWVNPDPYMPVVKFLRNATEPLLWRVRRILPFTNMRGIDLSPIVLMLVLHFINRIIVSTLFDIAHQLKA